MQPFLLGEWLIRPAENRIFGPLGERRLEPRVMQCLCRLAEAGSAPVRRSTLLSELWWERDVGDEVLSTAISALRRALGDDFRSPRYIETLPKAGYRLVQQPRQVSESSGSGSKPTANQSVLSEIRAGENSDGSESQAEWLYRMGRYHFDRRSASNMALCMELFEQSVEADPGFAPARAWLALICQMMPLYDPAADRGTAKRARDLALGALGLDRDEPIAQLVMANEAVARLRWVEAANYFDGALLCGPAEAPVHSAYAEFLSRVGHSRQALAHARRAWELNSTSSGDNLILGWMLLHGDDTAAVSRHASLAEQLGARAVFVDNLKGFALHRNGWQPADQEQWQSLNRRNANEPRWLWPEPLVNALLGHKESKQVLPEIKKIADASHEGFGLAYFFCGVLELPDQAFEFADQAIEQGSLFVVDPWLAECACLRSDPRFAALMNHLGLSKVWERLGPPDGP